MLTKNLSQSNRSGRSTRVVALSFLTVALLSLPTLGQTYGANILTSNIANISNNADMNLANPWGLVASPAGPWWMADNGNGDYRHSITDRVRGSRWW